MKKRVFASKKSVKSKRSKKVRSVFAYTVVFCAVIGMISASTQQGVVNDSVISTSAVEEVAQIETLASVDQMVEAVIVADLAEVANLPVAANTANISASLSIKHEVQQSNEAVLTKPQIIDVSNLSRGIKVYTVKEGDDLAKIADEYGVTTTTIRWANGMKDDAVSAGTDLVIPPVDGVVYTVKADDTVEGLADKYKSNAEQIIIFNDLEIDGLKADKKIVLPGGELPEVDRPEYVAPVVITNVTYSGGGGSSNAYAGVSAGNKYAYGYCTWYAYERRAQMGRPIGSYWGNASSWLWNAQAAGFRTGKTPEVGAIQQNSGGWGGMGHVAVVESVNYDNQTYVVSEMNNSAYGGWNIRSTRTVSFSEIAAWGYSFIY